MKYIIKTVSILKEVLKNKSALIIPIYSMRDYNTGLYDLNCDGNLHITMNMLSLLDASTSIMLAVPEPKKCKSLASITNYTSHLECDIEIVSCSAYGKNAQETRLNKEGWESFLESEHLHEYDLIIFTPQMCYPYFEKCGKLPLIYWMYHSRTETYNPEYLHPVNAWDKYIAEHCRTFVASHNQYKHVEGAKLDNAWYNAAYMKKVYEPFLNAAVKPFPMPTIFIPFRQSHAGYQLELLFDALASLENKYNILYSAPNGAVLESMPEYAMRIASDKETYILTLRHGPLIPLLENVDDLLHYSMYEFANLGAKILTIKNRHIQAQHSILNLPDITLLKGALKNIYESWQTL